MHSVRNKLLTTNPNTLLNMLSLVKSSTTANISLPLLTVIQRAADSIQAVDESANLRVQDGTITWLSPDLLESVTIDFLEMNDTTCVWAEHLECDAPIVAAAFQHLEASLKIVRYLFLSLEEQFLYWDCSVSL